MDADATDATWVAINRQVASILPRLPEHRTSVPRFLLPDEILEAADGDAEVAVQSLVFRNALREAAAPADEWTAWTDEEIYARVFDALPPDPGPLWVVADGGSLPGVPVKVKGEQLPLALAKLDADLHLDAVFVWHHLPRISIVHHSGAGFHIRRN